VPGDDGGDYSGCGEDEDVLEELHQMLANLMLVLVALHVGGVALASFRARATVTGDKRAADPGYIA
jgi:cytochrome b